MSEAGSTADILAQSRWISPFERYTQLIQSRLLRPASELLPFLERTRPVGQNQAENMVRLRPMSVTPMPDCAIDDRSFVSQVNQFYRPAAGSDIHVNQLRMSCNHKITWETRSRTDQQQDLSFYVFFMLHRTWTWIRFGHYFYNTFRYPIRFIDQFIELIYL